MKQEKNTSLHQVEQSLFIFWKEVVIKSFQMTPFVLLFLCLWKKMCDDSVIQLPKSLQAEYF